VRHAFGRGKDRQADFLGRHARDGGVGPPSRTCGDGPRGPTGCLKARPEGRMAAGSAGGQPPPPKKKGILIGDIDVGIFSFKNSIKL
jgi:hypothetical protein